MNARDEILSSIRQAIGTAPDVHDTIPREYIQHGTLDREPRLNLFAERLADYDARVHRSAEGDVAETIALALRDRNKTRMIVPEGFPAAWLPPGFSFLPELGLSYDELDAAEGVVTACTIAIAFTGTIILQNAPGQGRRAISLIPDYHLCIVRAAQVVETVPEAIRFLQATNTLATTTISGPSATADIEMTRVKGVHGPRILEIVLVT